MALRWGIASAGRISHDFVAAVQSLPAGDHEIVAVAARGLKGAQEFASSHNIPKALEGYEALAKSQDVDIVYIGVINTLHLDVAELMLENGKHVLCEKPLTMNAKQTKRLLDLAKAKGLFFMEAVWSRCFPIYKELRKQIDDGVIGDVVHAYVTFGVKIATVDRVNQKELGGGAILDIGIYALQFAQFVFKGVKPEKLVGLGSTGNGVDLTANAIISYPGNKSAMLSLSTYNQYPNEAVVVGTKGSITVCSPFWCPTKLVTPNGVIEKSLPDSKQQFNFSNSVGLAYEADECRKCIKAGLLENPSMTHAESLQLAELEDAWRKEVGVTYDADK